MSENQNQLLTYAVVALVVGLVIGYAGDGMIGGNNVPQGDEELQAALSEAQAKILTLEAQIESLSGDSELSGDLFISGSSTVFPIADLAAEDFQNVHQPIFLLISTNDNERARAD